jgi:carboxypeptidase Q
LQNDISNQQIVNSSSLHFYDNILMQLDHKQGVKNTGSLHLGQASVRAMPYLIVFFTLMAPALSAQQTATQDERYVRGIFDRALTQGQSYAWLEHICLRIGHRLTGSVQAEKAVAYTRQMLDTLQLDSVWLQPVRVPVWVRGEQEVVRIKTKTGSIDLAALALGGSIPTGTAGIQSRIVEVRSWEQLDTLGEKAIKGAIVFYNRPMDPKPIRTFEAYGGCVDQRVHGASRAAKYGAIGVVVRSIGLRLDDFPHTGSIKYDSLHPLIPACAISTQGAEQLHKLLKTEPTAQLFMRMTCSTKPDTDSHNVIGELRGSEKPDRVILVGGHLDSWDVGHGAHDDGAGVVQSMEVIRILQQLGYKPRHTIRCVLFMNEENGLRGGQTYAVEANKKNEIHICAIETDAGGFSPRGFSFEGDPTVIDALYAKIKRHESVFQPYGLTFARGGSGADISPLRGQKQLLCGYVPDSQRYFDYHHTAADVFDAVNQRELELGAASMAALIYLIDQYGL